MMIKQNTTPFSIWFIPTQAFGLVRNLIFGLVAALALNTTVAKAHGVPVNVFLNTQTQQLYTLPFFTSGPFLPFGGPVYTTDPGLGIINPGNGIPDGTTLGLNVLRSLLYADDRGITEAPAGIEIELTAPLIDGFGNAHSSPVLSYTVSDSSTYQTGLTWGGIRWNGSRLGCSWDVLAGRYQFADGCLRIGGASDFTRLRPE